MQALRCLSWDRKWKLSGSGFVNYLKRAGARETLRQLCELADGISAKFSANCWDSRGARGRSGAAGTWRLRAEMLFPYSDLDLLFLFGSQKSEEEFRPLISEFSRTLWDLGFRVSSAGRTLEECRHIEESNSEFHLAMLDRRFLDGDAQLFEKLDTKVLLIPEKQARPCCIRNCSA